MVRLAQLVRASDCGSEGRGFETHISPQKASRPTSRRLAFFVLDNNIFPDPGRTLVGNVILRGYGTVCLPSLQRGFYRRLAGLDDVYSGG